MRKFLSKHGHIISVFALAITTFVANRSCVCLFHQSKLPDSAKRLRKF